MQELFWISTILVVYTYAGYPALAWVLARFARKSVRKAPILPRVTVLTAAYNEAAYIATTVLNKLEQDYPKELLDVIVISDGSTDGTDDIVRSLGSRVRLLRQQPRAGKTAALNLALAHADGEIVVFSDANSMYGPGAIRQLVSNFADTAVGYVTGKMVYVNNDGSLVGDGCSAYMRYENWLRRQEARFGSVIGVDGGIDAVRKELYEPMRPDQLPDFVLPLRIAARGIRVVYEPRALLYEAALTKRDDEYRMRVRVGLRALWALWDERRLMDPFRRPILTFQIVSHKFLRYLCFIPLILALSASVALAARSEAYLWAAALQATFYLLAVVGGRWRSFAAGRLMALPYYFLLVNAASAHAAFRFLRGERQAIWAPRVG